MLEESRYSKSEFVSFHYYETARRGKHTEKDGILVIARIREENAQHLLNKGGSFFADDGTILAPHKSGAYKIICVV